MNNRHICPNCGGTEFITVAHIMQDWKVDQDGNLLELVDPFLQCNFPPDDSNIWSCTKCGAEGVVILSDNNVKE